MEKNRAYSVLELIGWGKYNFLLFIQCGLAWSTYDYWYESLAFIIEGIIDEWNISTLQAGTIGSFLQIGLFIGSFIWGYIAGKYGRMHAFKSTIIVVTIGSFLLTFSPNYYVISAALTIIGVGMAGEISLAGTVFYEFCPPSKRWYMTLMSLFLSFGSISAALVAFLVSLFNKTGFYNWRIIVGVGAVLEILSMIFRFFMHETPAFLITQNKQSAADNILNIVSLKNTGKTLDKIEYSSSLNPNEFTQEVEEEKTQEHEKIIDIMKKLFKPPLLKTTIFLGFVYMFASYSYSGYMSFMPEFLKEFSTSTSYFIIVIQQSAGIPAVVLGTYLVETRCGRKYTTLIFFILSGLSILVFTFTSSFWFILITSSIGFSFIYLAYASMFTIGPESFPTSVRSAGLGVIHVMSRVGGFLSPIIIGYLLELSSGVTLSLLSLCVTFSAAGAFMICLKETRGTKIG
ncbi:hypothetical protein SteCoe_23532 [Stentor coeruleus]|uniref:Major facilitator superfamily (MFS) profile domain-containing protein n=1 Tax=Stentor coeruleus TaxID=5963 RepID=A0A1R2BJP5_9CILI|nr:hypothetical protein SteCoe_23532 [Stentor coeruleus]